MAAVSLVSLANTYYDKGTTNEQRNSITAELQTLKVRGSRHPRTTALRAIPPACVLHSAGHAPLRVRPAE